MASTSSWVCRQELQVCTLSPASAELQDCMEDRILLENRKRESSESPTRESCYKDNCSIREGSESIMCLNGAVRDIFCSGSAMQRKGDLHILPSDISTAPSTCKITLDTEATSKNASKNAHVVREPDCTKRQKSWFCQHTHCSPWPQSYLAFHLVKLVLLRQEFQHQVYMSSPLKPFLLEKPWSKAETRSFYFRNNAQVSLRNEIGITWLIQACPCCLHWTLHI